MQGECPSDLNTRQKPGTAAYLIQRDPCSRGRFRSIRILFRRWKKRKPYDEPVYQGAVAARRTEEEPAHRPVTLQWKMLPDLENRRFRGLTEQLRSCPPLRYYRSGLGAT